MSIENEVRQGWHDAIIEMFEIDLSTIAEGFSGQYFLTNEIMPDDSFVQWKGQVYTAFPIQAGGFDTTTKGPMPQPELTLANIFGSFSALISTADDLVGAKVTRRRTLFKYLDNGPFPDSSQEFPDDIFYIERKVAETNLAITWQLASKIDLEGLLLPRRVITQNHCLWTYRGAECGYAGPPVANEFDGALTGGSVESGVYVDALNALLSANAALNTAEAELNVARSEEEIACASATLQKSDPVFDLRNHPYTFGILNGAAYFAAYKDGNLIPSEKFSYDFSPEEGDAVFGANQNTGNGYNQNSTGTLWAVNRWVGVDVSPANDGSEIEAQLTNENEYDPPDTFAMLDLNGNVLIARNGTIRQNVSNVKEGKAPSITVEGEVVFARGAFKAFEMGPVTELEIWELSSEDCDKATERLADAEAAFDAAEAAKDAAQTAYDEALANLPADDPVYSQDRCGKRLTSCRLRFGTSTLPFGAFPGANLYQ